MKSYERQGTPPKRKLKKKSFSFLQKSQEEYYGSNQNFKLTSDLLFIKEEKDGKVSYKPVSKYMKISQVEQAEETNDVTLTLEYSYLDKKRSIEVTRDQLHPNDIQKLSKKGVDVFYHNAKQLIQYLRIQEESAPYTTVHTHMGWQDTPNGLLYKHQKIIGENAPTSSYKGDYNLKPKGNLAGWKSIVADEVIGNVNLELALTMGFSAAVVGMLSTLKDADTLIMHICGKSTRGKTTAAQLAVSPFGRPSKTSKGLIKSWNATGNAVVSYLRNNYGVPIVLDEASMSNLKDFTSLIYTFAENREKDRMTKEGGLRDQGNWSTTIISIAEHSIFQKTNANEGLRVRVFEFANTTWTNSGENADNLKRRLLDHYGHAGIEFVRYLQSLDVEEVEERCNRWKDRCEETLPDSDFVTRVSEKFGMILATADLVNESLGLGLNLEQMMERLHEVEQEISMERNQSDKAYHFMLEQVIKNYGNFRSHDRVFTGRECWGVIKYETDHIEVAVLKHQFHRLMKEASVSDPKVVLEQWREEKRLKTEPNKFTNRRKVGTKEFRKKVGLPEGTGTRGQDVVYVLLFDRKQLKQFGIRKVLKSEEISKMQRLMLPRDVATKKRKKKDNGNFPNQITR
ncbi:hypothetical protein AWM70_17275 [Paenibacillus yonginensis]|uniref:DUF927 domain-containing protein n=1 Tax=Paenibacillus yonginensis TaxID=1462996 RepID=A0A1B1N3X2_9BACL|nr:DUF927 domain-containing protein [Paenibacillus yonginensis]ANS76117.1 hypothetical protein AWM70_17275 [Paenibacillus yonginensis]